MAFHLRSEGIQSCCKNLNCLRNFIDIPQRMITLPWDQLYVDSECECDCGKPQNTPALIDYLLYDLEEDYANDCMDIGYRCLWPGNTRHVQCFYRVRTRYFERFGSESYRRNIVNAFFFMPQKNAFIRYHQTYRYSPRHITVENLLGRIFIDALHEVQGFAQDPTILGHFCTCETAQATK